MRTVPHRQASQHGYAPCREVIIQYVDHRPNTWLGFGGADELSDCDAFQPVRVPSSAKLCQGCIDRTDGSIHSFEEEDCTCKIWAGPTDCARNHTEIASDQDAAGRSRQDDFRGGLGFILMDGDGTWLHQRLA